MASSVPVLTMDNGGKMPLIGLGTYQGRENEMRQILKEALECGYRHIDTATLYQNEEVIGDVLQEWISAGKVSREDLFVVTKLPQIGNRAKDVGRFLQKSLDKLRLSYVDLYLIHSPIGLIGKDDNDVFPHDAEGNVTFDFDTKLEEIYKAMEEQVDAGKTKAIGISNFNSQQIERILKICRIKPSNHQIEVHVYLQQQPLRELCRLHGITICAYSPLAAPYKEPGSEASPPLLKDPVVTSMACCLGRTPAQVLLRFLVQNNIPVIPKTTNSKRLKENFQIFDYELSPEDMRTLETLDRKEAGRVFTYKKFWKGVEKHPEYPFKIPF